LAISPKIVRIFAGTLFALPPAIATMYRRRSNRRSMRRRQAEDVMPEWYDLRYEDIKHELDPRLRELHEELIARLEAIAIAREPGLTHAVWEQRVAAQFERRRRERAEGSR
jgi:hypothetical protein